MYLPRIIENKIISPFIAYEGGALHPEVAVIEGVVGVGKTTMIERILQQETIRKKYVVFKFNMDETKSRIAVRDSSDFFFEQVATRTTVMDRALVFVDEAQKSDEMFDAVKFAWDKGINFILTGSNPHYMKTRAKKALQRRSRHFDLKPFSLVEILGSGGHLPDNFDIDRNDEIILSFLYGDIGLSEVREYIERMPITLTQNIADIIELFLKRGGIPLSFLAKTSRGSYESLRAVIERGFELIEKDRQNIFDDVVYELSLLSAREFTYKNILRKLRLKKRDTINIVIDQLIGQGYLTEKRPYIRDEGFGSYHVIYSLIDPGIINYFWQKDKLTNEDKGAFIESYVSARIENILTNGHKRHKIDYYKPYRIGNEMGEDKLRFDDGEIDFVVSFGKGPSTAVEVKSGEHIKASDVPLLGKSQKEGLFFQGIILYKGVPRIEGNLLFWPFWLI